MELFSTDFLSALVAIVIIDLVLAGDNAIVIALAARNLPRQLRTRAIIWGTVGAIVVRTALTLVAVWLLKVPGLMAIGGALLVGIAWKLLVDAEQEDAGRVGSAASFWGAVRTILVADALMGLDNVLGVAGAAQGSFLLVALGLLISIPIVIWGSQIILKLLTRYPAIIYLGAGVLAWTAATMIAGEPLLEDLMVPGLKWMLYAVVIGGVLAGGLAANHRKSRPHVTDLADAAAGGDNPRR